MPSGFRGLRVAAVLKHPASASLGQCVDLHGRQIRQRTAKYHRRKVVDQFANLDQLFAVYCESSTDHWMLQRLCESQKSGRSQERTAQNRQNQKIPEYPEKRLYSFIVQEDLLDCSTISHWFSRHCDLNRTKWGFGFLKCEPATCSRGRESSPSGLPWLSTGPETLSIAPSREPTLRVVQ